MHRTRGAVTNNEHHRGKNILQQLNKAQKGVSVVVDKICVSMKVENAKCDLSNMWSELSRVAIGTEIHRFQSTMKCEDFLEKHHRASRYDALTYRRPAARSVVTPTLIHVIEKSS